MDASTLSRHGELLAEHHARIKNLETKDEQQDGAISSMDSKFDKKLDRLLLGIIGILGTSLVGFLSLLLKR